MIQFVLKLGPNFTIEKVFNNLIVYYALRDIATFKNWKTSEKEKKVYTGDL